MNKEQYKKLTSLLRYFARTAFENDEHFVAWAVMEDIYFLKTKQLHDSVQDLSSSLLNSAGEYRRNKGNKQKILAMIGESSWTRKRKTSYNTREMFKQLLANRGEF